MHGIDTKEGSATSGIAAELAKATAGKGKGFVPVVQATDGTLISPRSMALTITNDSQGRPIQIDATDGVNTFRLTVSYPANQISISKWVKQ